MVTELEAQARLLLERAEGVFANTAKAEAWWNERNPALGWKAPCEVVQSEEGAAEVTAMLGRISEGIIS